MAPFGFFLSTSRDFSPGRAPFPPFPWFHDNADFFPATYFAQGSLRRDISFLRRAFSFLFFSPKGSFFFTSLHRFSLLHSFRVHRLSPPFFPNLFFCFFFFSRERWVTCFSFPPAPFFFPSPGWPSYSLSSKISVYLFQGNGKKRLSRSRSLCNGTFVNFLYFLFLAFSDEGNNFFLRRVFPSLEV